MAKSIGSALRSLKSGRPFLVRNSLAGRTEKEPLICRSTDKVTWYSCGPTVYDDTHLGHALTFVSFDVIRRIITNISGKPVDFALGMTDIDDKIRDRALKEKVLSSALSQYYENRFMKDMKALNVLPPTKVLRVSEYVDDIRQMAFGLVDKGVAYRAPSGSIYFSVESRGERYLQLDPSRSLRETVNGQSEHNPNISTSTAEKRNSEDFVIWKVGSDEDSTFLDDIWKMGRPGWHIECSAMILATLGSQIDIHSGGLDLRFPHHTNELATAEAQLSVDPCVACDDTQHRWAHTWLHSGSLLIENRKMSKSLKNFITVRSFLENNACADTFRMFCMLRKYSSSTVLTDRHIENAASLLSRIRSFVSRNPVQDLLREKPLHKPGVRASFRPDCSHGKLLHDTTITVEDNIDAALTDDFDTSTAVSHIAQLVQVSNKVINNESGLAVSGHAALAYEHAKNVVRDTLLMLGISQQGLLLTNETVPNASEANSLGSVIDEYVRFRSLVRTAARQQDLSAIFKACDDARSTAREKHGISVTDLKDGSSSWSRV